MSVSRGRSLQRPPAPTGPGGRAWVLCPQGALPPFPTALTGSASLAPAFPSPEHRHRPFTEGMPLSARVAVSVALNHPWPVAPGFLEVEMSSLPTAPPERPCLVHSQSGLVAAPQGTCG